MAADEVPELRTVFEIIASKDSANTNATAARPAISLVDEYRAAAAKRGTPLKGTDIPRTIRMRGEINEEMADQLTDILQLLDKVQPGAPIELRINSPGGEVMAGLRIYDTMKSLKSPIATVCDGECMSMAAVLLAAGSPGMRSAAPNSVIMIHELSAQLPGGKYSNIKSWQKYADMLEDKLVTILANYTGRSKQEFAEIMRNDTFYSADEAQKLNLIDRVQAPVQQPPKQTMTPVTPFGPPRLVHAA